MRDLYAINQTQVIEDEPKKDSEFSLVNRFVYLLMTLEDGKTKSFYPGKIEAELYHSLLPLKPNPREKQIVNNLFNDREFTLRL